jgi:hypothetical protein
MRLSIMYGNNMKYKSITAGLLALLVVGQASANLVTTDNLLKNIEFAPEVASDGSLGDRTDWTVISGAHRYPELSPGEIDGMEPGVDYRASFGAASDQAYIRQYLSISETGVNARLVDEGLVTMDMSAYIGSSFSDRDRSRMYVYFYDENGVQLGAPPILGYYDLESWSYREMTDIPVPELTRDFSVTIHHDRVDGNGNSTGIALPSVRFAMEDTEESRVALSQFGALRDVPVIFASGLALFGLGLRRRK